MKVVMVQKISPLLKSKLTTIPLVILQHIESEIKEYNDQLIDEYNDQLIDEHSENEIDKKQNYNPESCCDTHDDKLKCCNFVFVQWFIDGITYYDVCHFKYDAEVGVLFKLIDDKIMEVCTIDNYRLIFPKEENDIKWCKKFEKKRIKIID